MRRDLALTGRLVAAIEGANKKTPGPNSLAGGGLGVVAISTCGARLVPRRPLQPYRAGFNSPALHSRSTRIIGRLKEKCNE
jgi:hypothetical protein